MPRQQSTETQLRTVKADLRRAEENLRVVRGARDAAIERAHNAEQELADWKRRFDLLLERTPKDPK